MFTFAFGNRRRAPLYERYALFVRKAHQAKASSSSVSSSSASNESPDKKKKTNSQKEDRQKGKDKRAKQPASEQYVKFKAKKSQKMRGRDARRDAHDKKENGEPDRNKNQIDEDYHY